MSDAGADARNAQTAAVILGASEYPLTNLNGTPAFRNSADGFVDYLTSANGLAVRSDRLLNLFDSSDSVLDQNKHIKAFLKLQQEAATLIVFYVGHGGFLPDREYFLALKSTEKDSEYLTGLRMRAMAHTLDLHFPNRQIILILDCCFAGEAVDEFQTGELLDVVGRQTSQALPVTGTSLLVASSKDRPAVAPAGRQFTMFSECLLDVLTRGTGTQKRALSLYDVGEAIQRLMRDRFQQGAVRPEVHSPRQTSGDPAKEEIFPNRDYRPPARPDLPTNIKEALASPYPGARCDGVDALARLVTSAGAEVALVAREALQNIADADDSKKVQECARKRLSELGPLVPADIASEPIRRVEPPVAVASAPTSVEVEPISRSESKFSKPMSTLQPEPDPQPFHRTQLTESRHTSGAATPVLPLRQSATTRLLTLAFVGGVTGAIGQSLGAALWPIVDPTYTDDWSWLWSFWFLAPAVLSATACIVTFFFAARFRIWQTYLVYFVASSALRLPFEGLFRDLVTVGYVDLEFFLRFNTPLVFVSGDTFNVVWIVSDSVFFATVATLAARRDFQRNGPLRARL